MTTVTLDLPDHLARYAAEQNDKNPGWFETLFRSALGTKEAGDSEAAEPAAPESSPFDRALEIYKRGNASIAGAAYAAGVDRFDFEDFLVDIHYPIPQQTVEEALAEVESLEQAFQAEQRQRRASA